MWNFKLHFLTASLKNECIYSWDLKCFRSSVEGEDIKKSSLYSLIKILQSKHDLEIFVSDFQSH